MQAYIYNADTYCEECAAMIRQELDEGPPVEDREDSDHYPQGPYSDGGGEADCPNNCGDCGLFLENPLTEDGVEYVREAIAEYRAEKTPLAGPCHEWALFYDYIEV